MHPLDRPIWSALNTRQAALAQGDAAALRFPVDVSPLAAPRDIDADAMAALIAMIPAGDDVSLLEPSFAEPVGATQTIGGPCLQMTARAFTPDQRRFSLEPLGDADAADMLELALLTRPGPFRARTHTLGRFLGIRDGSKLVAMAGERLHVDGFHEISAVCTHPDYRGRGYGAALMRAVGDRMLAEGDTPFLHTYVHNTVAIALYRSLGFEVRAEVTHVVWRRTRG